VLILALWVVFFLAALAVAVGIRVSASLDLARRVQGDTTTYFLAKAGIERVMMEVVADTNAWDGLDEPWFNDEKSFRDVEMGKGSYSVSYETRTLQGKTETRYGVIGEESKININQASLGFLKAFLETAGGVDSITATEMASAIVDWRDPDDDPLTGGAENSYYESQTPSYQCHNCNFESVNELLLVKGIGTELFSKIRPYVTVYGTGKVNVNTADPVVLRSVAYSCGGQTPVTCESVVAKLMAFRNAGGVFREPVSATMIGQLGGTAALRNEEMNLFVAMMGTIGIRSTCFFGTASGKLKGMETAQSLIDFVFDRDQMTVLCWNEH
jgi:general secretion pathway protein K